MSADKAPADKLPLAIRRNVRDGWENKKADLEAQLLTLLGVPWTLETNPLAIFPYAEAGSYGHSSLGDCIFAYFDGFLYNLKYFLERHGEEGKTELNFVCPTHIITFIPSTKFTYNGVDVADGTLRLLFHPNYLGTNVGDVGQQLADALSSAPQPAGASPLSFAARHSIKTEYDAEIGALIEKARAALQNPEFVFEPCFEELAAQLKGGKDVRDDWERNLGGFAKAYFESFVDVLASEKFGEDEMLREGLEEGAPKGAVRLRIVQALETAQTGYNEIVLDEGALAIQTTPGYWGTNTYYAASKLVDIL